MNQRRMIIKELIAHVSLVNPQSGAFVPLFEPEQRVTVSLNSSLIHNFISSEEGTFLRVC